FYDFYNQDENLGKLVSKEVVQSNWHVAVNASPKGTFDCVSAWLTDFRNDLPKIDIPVLIIQVDTDRILPFPSPGERLVNELKGSRLVILRGAPHGIPWTHAADINRELMKFLSGIAQQQSQAWAPSGYS